MRIWAALPVSSSPLEDFKSGASRIIRPVGNRWDDFFLDGPRVSDDFMTEREQPAAEDREPFL